MEILGKGSVAQRDKDKSRARCRNWELCFKVKENNRKRQKTKVFHGIYSDALIALEEFRNELLDTEDVGDISLVKVAWQWHELRVKSMTLAKSSTDNDQYRIKPIEMHLDVPVVQITADMIVDTYWKLSQGETPSGRPWKPKTLEDQHKAFTSIFRFAKIKKYIDDNPMDLVKAPLVEEVYEDTIPSKNVDYLIRYIDYSEPTQRTIALIAGTGIRLGEACRAEWSDLTDCLIVRKSKNHKSRSIPVPQFILNKLKPYRTRGLISEGVKPASVRRWLTRHGAEYFIPHASPHDLRHSYCTRLAEAETHPRVMMDLMGHETMDVCMKVYTHVNGVTRNTAVLKSFAL